MTGSRSFPVRPIVGIGVVVFKADRVLLVRRSKPPMAARWSLPGGAQELDETAQEAARREVFEETGVVIDTPELLDVVDYIDRGADGRVRHHFTLIDYLARWRLGEATPGGDAEAVRWMALDALEAIGLWEETLRVIALGAQRLGLST